MNQYLVVGGSAVAGQAAIRCIRQHASGARIVATSSSDKNVTGADYTLCNIDLTRNGAQQIIAKLSDQSWQAILYIPARGLVGRPVQYARQADLLESLEFSVIPALQLCQALKPQRLIWLSGFMWLSVLQLFYGSMTYTKICMEQLTLAHPDLIRCIRLGTFVSRSTRGIAVLLQRTMQADTYPELAFLKQAWKESGLRFRRFFNQYAFDVEKKELNGFDKSNQPYRPLNETDIEKAFYLALFTESQPIINVVGNWVWQDDHLPDWPQAIKKGLGLIPGDLSQYLYSPV